MERRTSRRVKRDRKVTGRRKRPRAIAFSIRFSIRRIGVLRVYFFLIVLSSYLSIHRLQQNGSYWQGYRLKWSFSSVRGGVRPNRGWFVNHPLVRQKFYAAFFFSLSRAIGSWKRKGATVWWYIVLLFPAFSAHFQSLSILLSSFLPSLQIRFFFFYICYFLSYFYSAYTLFSFYYVFLCIVFSSYLFFRFSATHFSFALLPSSRILRSNSLRDRVGNWGGYRVDLRSPQGDNYL